MSEQKRALPNKIKLSTTEEMVINVGSAAVSYVDCAKLLNRIDLKNNWVYSVLAHPSGLFIVLETQSDDALTGFGITRGSYEARVISREEARKIVTENGEGFDDDHIDDLITNLGKYYNNDGSRKI